MESPLSPILSIRGLLGTQLSGKFYYLENPLHLLLSPHTPPFTAFLLLKI